MLTASFTEAPSWRGLKREAWETIGNDRVESWLVAVLLMVRVTASFAVRSELGVQISTLMLCSISSEGG
jgi:hypothetical protein